ncbi:flagellar protein FliT [Bordetella genomosp. 2]|uniref:Flagellar protein FliT n=1 Tax=Bordetella genomosp. 2 TaxID=1983456 RepID=A0A261VNB1_9BORD|nr:flagellar protein FliT [Bordetella genomosp. 2]OZI75614.1 flagellar protein FliT [Bordetella genomosp. 2]
MTSTLRHAPVLDIYREIANLTDQMHAAARAGDWSTVLNCGQRYCELVERLRIVDPVTPLDHAGREAKYDLLVRILDNDAATRDLAIPQMARLSDLLGRMKRQQSLLSAYGTQPSAA